MSRLARIAACGLALAACRKGAEEPKPAAAAAAEAEDGTAWLAGTWRRTTDDGRFAGWLLFRPPRTAAAVGAHVVRGTYVSRGDVVSLLAPLRSGVVAQSQLTASADRRTLTFDDGGKPVVFEHASPTSALDAVPATRPAESPDAGGPADPAAWLQGTWQRAGADRWLLFNPPAEVIELAGRPAAVVRRGTLVVHQRFVDALFREGEIHLVADEERSSLRSDERPAATYRRGSPPP